MKKPQTMSLQDQLLKSGLTNDNKIKQVKADKRKQVKQQHTQGVEIIDEIKISVEQTRLQQAERDRALNQARKEAEAQKAIVAQIKDLVERNCIRQEENGVAYQFTDKNKVKTVYLSEKVRLSVVNGRTGIVKIDNTYELVPAEIAKKILERSAESVIVLLEPTSELIAEDDPYANYQVPDDLIW